MWKWKLQYTHCGICKDVLDKPCMIIGSGGNNTVTDFSLYSTIWTSTTCGHAYHCVCIMDWLRRRPVCPYCNAPWNSYNEKKIETMTNE